MSNIMRELEITYIERVNQAVAEDDRELIGRLAAEYDEDLAQLQVA